MNDYKLTLKAARVNVGLTQKELAKLMNKSETTIINWEKRGIEDIKIKDFKKLCEVLKVGINQHFF